MISGIKTTINLSTNLAGIYEFHVSRNARDLYTFDEDLFSVHGQVLFANFRAARRFAHKINARRDLVHFPEQAVKISQINAMGLIDEIMHVVVGLYRQEINPDVIQEALAWVVDRSGSDAVKETLIRFTDQFPPLSVYRREVSPEEYIEAHSLDTSHKQISLEEMVMLWLANSNPAYSPYGELFDDSVMERYTAYIDIIDGLKEFFATQPKFGPFEQPLIDMLRSPAVAVPNSIPGQLEYIREHWGYLLGDHLFRLLSGLDLIREEEKIAFPGRGPSVGFDLSSLEFEGEQYSRDRDWMPQLVLIAKNIYVWLDQLSKQYNREIRRLDDIPDEILDQLANWGITGIWLIGVWERSPASSKIKQISGNPEAQASAYSLFDYQIATDLGGEQALSSLQTRAWQRGIRLGSDMVPNHMGIDSRWIIEHPDWFLSLPDSPYPAYTFNGVDLSSDASVGLFIEDHYYDRSDAAVVFKRVDRNTGHALFIYHGNDGTSMPWNDTAQLDYLNPAVREGVIQTILHVARMFPVIRFDAAMTLAKKHYQRLWFPIPGTGGSIPSRAEFGMTKAEFDQAMPNEFWRELVDRVAQEAPDTLLLAEAFWLMEGYFVRTLGMHRVYNSAFMNMLRDEENSKYREVLKKTLEFDPQILKRFVNFMSNPDEETAIEQFGKDGKYFGVCTLMATMPGLPMFAHGQIEGYGEKYGMEYHEAKWDEKPDTALVQRHEHQIFPLLKRRHLFADVDQFQLYDFFSSDGSVNEDVFVYSNRVADERTLIAYNNRYNQTSGWIRTSAAKLDLDGSSQRTLLQLNLCQGLNLRNDPGYFTIFMDQVTGLEYIRKNQELFASGLYLDFEAYTTYVFLNFREVLDNEWHHYAHLEAYLAGRGVPSIDEAMRATFLQPIHQAFRKLMSLETLNPFIDMVQDLEYLSKLNVSDDRIQSNLDGFERHAENLYKAINDHVNGSANPAGLAKEMRIELETMLDRSYLCTEKLSKRKVTAYKTVIKYIEDHPETLKVQGAVKLVWLCCQLLGKVIDVRETNVVSRSWMDEWQLNRIAVSALESFGIAENHAWQIIRIINIMITHRDWNSVSDTQPMPLRMIVEEWLRDTDVQEYLSVNRYQGVLWFHKESFDVFIRWMFWLATFRVRLIYSRDLKRMQAEILNVFNQVEQISIAAENAEYRIDKFMENLDLS